jgi:hypothetical protein
MIYRPMAIGARYLENFLYGRAIIGKPCNAKIATYVASCLGSIVPEINSPSGNSAIRAPDRGGAASGLIQDKKSIGALWTNC